MKMSLPLSSPQDGKELASRLEDKAVCSWGAETGIALRSSLDNYHDSKCVAFIVLVTDWNKLTDHQVRQWGC